MCSISTIRASDVWASYENLRFRGQNLTTAIHAGLKINVVLTAKLAAVLIFDVVNGAQAIMRAALATA
jgi:hypothetical protein